jgi:hypothetical protein
MVRLTKNPATGKEERWYNVAEAADYIQRTEATFRVATKRYTEKTGKEITFEQNGNERLYSETDLNTLLKELYPFIARQKGLT